MSSAIITIKSPRDDQKVFAYHDKLAGEKASRFRAYRETRFVLPRSPEKPTYEGMTFAMEQINQSLRDLRDDVKGVREEVQYVRSRIDNVDKQLGDANTGLGALNSAIGNKPGHFVVGVYAAAIVAAITAFAIYGEQIRTWLAG